MKISELVNNIECLEKRMIDDGTVTDIVYNSKLVKPGAVFVAIAGLNSDGRHYVPDAVTKGASLIVTDGMLFDNLKVSQIRVLGAREALSCMAASFFKEPTRKVYVAGVTGTNGKTTLTYLLEALWQGRKTGIVGTINTRYAGHVEEATHTTPESRDLQNIFLKMIENGVTHAAIEASSHAIYLKRVENVHFNCCIFTNLTQDHLDFHTSMEEYFSAKEKLFTRILKQSVKQDKLAIVHGDGLYEEKLIKKINAESIPLATYGFSNNNNLYPKQYVLNASGFNGTFLWDGKEIFIESSLMGRFNMLNVMAAMMAARHSGVTDKDIVAGIKKFTHTPGRLERVNDRSGRHIFVDYAHTPDAIKNVMETLHELKNKKLLVVFGCGGDRDPTKRPKMGFEAARLADICVVTSDNPRTEDPDQIIKEIIPGLDKAGIKPFDGQKGFLVEVDRKKALQKIIQISGKDDIILVAGKGHEDYQIIGRTKTHFSDQEILRELVQ